MVWWLPGRAGEKRAEKQEETTPLTEHTGSSSLSPGGNRSAHETKLEIWSVGANPPSVENCFHTSKQRASAYGSAGVLSFKPSFIWINFCQSSHTRISTLLHSSPNLLQNVATVPYSKAVLVLSPVQLILRPVCNTISTECIITTRGKSMPAVPTMKFSDKQ